MRIGEKRANLDFRFESSFELDSLSWFLPALAGSKLERLYIPVEFTRHEISLLALALPRSRIKTLIFVVASDIQDIDALASCLPETLVESLSVQNCRLASLGAFTTALPYSRISLLELSGNDITRDQYENMVQVVKYCPLLVHIDLSGNLADTDSGDVEARLTAELKRPRLVYAQLFAIRSCQECNRVGKNSALKMFPRELCRSLASFLVNM